MKTHCFSLDLKDDLKLIEDYKNYHKNVSPETEDSLKESGIQKLDIYLTDNKLFMIMEVNDFFSFEDKTKIGLEDPKVQEWEKLMWKFQQKSPLEKEGEKWILMDDVYQL